MLCVCLVAFQQVKSYQALDLESYDVFLKFAPDPTRPNFAYSLIERQNPHLQPYYSHITRLKAIVIIDLVDKVHSNGAILARSTWSVAWDRVSAGPILEGEGESLGEGSTREVVVESAHPLAG